VSETAETYRRRRLTALAALVGVLLVAALGIRACTGDEVIPGVVTGDDAESAPAKTVTARTDPVSTYLIQLVVILIAAPPLSGIP